MSEPASPKMFTTFGQMISDAEKPKKLREYIYQKSTYSADDIQEQLRVWTEAPNASPPEDWVNKANAGGKTPLHFAAQLRSDGVVESLLALRADINRATIRGHTPLIYACGRGRNEVVRCLLDAGARCCVRTANGCTAESFGEDRLSPEVLEEIQLRVQSESGRWLDFEHDEAAVKAQADHVVELRKQHLASGGISPAWFGDISTAVAKALEQHEIAATTALSPVQVHAEELARRLAPLELGSEALAEVLLESVSSLPRKMICSVLKKAMLQRASECEDAVSRVHGVLRAQVVAVPTVSRRIAKTGATALRRTKQAKSIAIACLLSLLKELKTSELLSLQTLIEDAPAWLVVELLYPPPSTIDLERDGPSLQTIIRGVCNEKAWGRDFHNVLRLLVALRPEGSASQEKIDAFDNLAAVYIEVVGDAIRNGQTMKRHAGDTWSIVDELRNVFGESKALDDLTASIEPTLNALPSSPKLLPIDFTMCGGFLGMPKDTEICWVDDSDSWLAAERRIMQAAVFALDTEWWDTGAGPALVQIAIPGPSPVCFLVDTLNVVSQVVDGLRRVFQIQDQLRLGWSFREDAKRLEELCGDCPGLFSVTDLQPRCKKIMQSPTHPSLTSTCAHILGQPLDKTEQCSDWRKRPLSKSQTIYAALDAVVLLQLLSKLGEQ